MSDFRWTWVDRVEADDSLVSSGARHLANVLVRHFVRKGEDVCWPGLRRLNRKMGTGNNTITHRFRELEHFGYLRTEHRGHGKSHIRYLLIPDSCETVPPWDAVRSRGGRQTVPPWDAASTEPEPEKPYRPRMHTVPPWDAEPLTRTPRSRWGGTHRRARIGDDGYAALLATAFSNGHITESELEQANLAHWLVELSESRADARTRSTLAGPDEIPWGEPAPVSSGSVAVRGQGARGNGAVL